MKLNLGKLIKSYGGKWVALSADSSRVLASGKKALQVYNQVLRLQPSVPKLFKVPSKYKPYIG